MKEAIYHNTKGTVIVRRELLELEKRTTCIIFPVDFSFVGGTVKKI